MEPLISLKITTIEIGRKNIVTRCRAVEGDVLIGLYRPGWNAGERPSVNFRNCPLLCTKSREGGFGCM